MLNEFKRPMWNDGYSKEQPWLNYFNSYERMHCCFGDEGGAGSDGASNAEDSGMTAAQAAEVAANMDAAAAAGASVEGQQAAGDVAAADIQGIDVSEVDSGMSRADASLTDIETLEDLGLIGYNDKQSLGYFDKAEAEDYARSQAEAAALQASYRDKGKDVNISVDKDNLYSYTGKDAGTVGLSEMGKGLSYAMASTGIGGLISGIARTLGINKEEVTAQDISMVTGGQNYGGLREEGITSDQEKDSKGIAGPAIDPSYGQGDPGTSYGAFFDINDFTREDDRNIDAELADFQAGLDREAANAAATQQQEAQETGGIADPYEVAYQASDPFNNYAAAMEEADAAMFGGNYAGQPDEMGFNNDYDRGGEDTPTILPILPTPDPEEKKEPETAMEAYFTKLGIASPVPTAPPSAGPVAPSSFQEYRSYLPPIGPADNAAYRRKLALGTPRYQEPSGPNPSISTLAAVYGLTYEEAAKRFAFPSVPKPPLADEQKAILFAASGGGLNSLMRYK